MKTLLRNVQKIFNEEKTAKEITQLINRIYRDYNDSYRNCLSNVGRIVDGNPKLMEELNNIAVYMKKDYEEDLENIKEIEEISFCDKKDKMLEHMEIVIVNLINQRNSANKHNETLQPILDVDEIKTEESEEREIIQNNINNHIINAEFCKRVVGSILSEIDSSKKSLISKLSGIKTQVDIDYAKNIFISEVDLIEDRIRSEFNYQIKDLINAQDICIANKIYSLYAEYIQQNEIDKGLSQRAKFLEDLHVEVNEMQAIKKADEPKELQKGKDYNPLGENVIE